MPPPRSPNPTKAIYGGIPERPPGNLDGQLLSFAEDLRGEGVAIGTSEILDAFEALEHVAWNEQRDFKEALSATLAKSSDDRRVFDLVFDRFFFRAAEAQAARQSITESPGATTHPATTTSTSTRSDSRSRPHSETGPMTR